MGKGRLFSAAAAAAVSLGLVGVGAPAARAGFQFNYTLTPGTGPLAGKNVFCFFAKNDQQGGQLGSKSLLAISVHIKPIGQPLGFTFTNLDGDGIGDADVAGKNQDENTVTGTFVRIGSNTDWLSAWVRPVGDRSNGTGYTPANEYSNVTDLWIEGFSQNKTLDATTGLGRFYAAAVVPANVNVNVVGRVAAEAGTIVGTPSSAVESLEALSSAVAPVSAEFLEAAAEAQAASTTGDFFDFNFTAVAPEPGAVGVLGVVGVAAMARRRRPQA
jgi:hypothetical protein